MTPSDVALERVQTLYILQTKLMMSLEGDLRKPAVRREVQSDMRVFQRLLSEADWRYMGGMDVMDSLRNLGGEVRLKLRALPVPKKAQPRRSRPTVAKVGKAARGKKVVVRAKKVKKTKRK